MAGLSPFLLPKHPPLLRNRSVIRRPQDGIGAVTAERTALLIVECLFLTVLIVFLFTRLTFQFEVI